MTGPAPSNLVTTMENQSKESSSAEPQETAESPAAGSRGSAGELVLRIRALLPSFSPAEQRVADAVLEDPAGTSGHTITELATAARTSETTVIRFCKALELSGYPELRLRLAAEAARESARESAGAAAAVAGEIGPDDTMAQIVEKVAYADARAVEETARQLDVSLLDPVAEALASARRIDIFGVGASGFVAQDFQQKLHRIGSAAFAWTDTHVAVASAALLRPGDVAVGISHTGVTSDTVDLLAEAHDHGATTVAVTNFPRSPISKVSDYVLTTAARETTFRSGATASRIAQLTVIDCLFVGIAQRHYPETLAALEATYDAVQGRRESVRGSAGRQSARGRR